MSTRRKLLFLCDYYPPAIGGIEVVNKELAERLAEDLDVTVFTQLLPHTQKESFSKNVRIVRCYSPLRSLFPVFGWWKALKLARQADIVQASPYSAPYLAGLMMPFVWKPYILHVHGFLGGHLANTLYGPVFAFLAMVYERMFFLLPWKRIICVSQNLQTRLIKEKVIKHTSEVIYNGVNVQLFTPIKDRSLRAELGFADDDILFVLPARPSPLKGADLALEAIPEMLKKHPKLHLVFFASSQDWKNWAMFQKLMQHNPDAKRVHVFEARPYEVMPRVYAMADLILIPSRSEGFCYQAAEAAAMQVPVLCSRNDSIPEIVSGKVIFIEKLDAADIQAGMEKFFAGEFEEIPQKHFSWEHAVNTWKQLYARL